MEILILIVAMVIVGVVIGWVAGLIWKDNRPIGVNGDYFVAIVSAIVVGLLDWYVIPAMGFSDNIKLIGAALEPPLSALAVLWVIRVAKKQ
ncbi:MAG: hypothetical protein ISR58_22315 [Anaerolineales bacterium]|nr:hypothetical protein [Chloroflexota bacterium]MBL6983930.1 hypothetical protein [Anaerolineales bacterium]